jgi:uncharacterized protein (DUF2062 family)
LTRDELRSKLRGAWRRLRGGELTPARAALSVAVGLFVGVTPAFGAHIFLVLLVCVPLNLDAPVSYLAANISIPPVAPFLWLAEVEIGAWLLTRHPLALHVDALRTTGPWAFAKELVVGTLFFAPATALIGGIVTYAAVAATRPPKPRSLFEEAVARVAARYGGESRAAYYHVLGKMRGDPVVRRAFELASTEPLGEVVDVGAGRGQLGILLLESNGATRVTGFDWDRAKVAEAQRASKNLSASFEEGDAVTHAIPACDSVLMIDVLHYLVDAEQDAVIRRAARAARRTVLIRELDPDRGWRSVATRIQEAITTTVRWNRGARVRVRPIPYAERRLSEEGFDVTVEPCWGSTPFANVLMVGRRREIS